MRRARTWWLAAIATSWACSSAMEPTPVEFCQSDADCSEDQVCGPTGFCSDQFFPLAYIAFDVQESAGSQTQFRAELFGCDQEVEARPPDGLEISQGVVSQTLELSVVRRDAANLEFMSVPLEATFELSQASRLSRPLFRRSVAHPPSEGEATSVEVRWPRYHPENQQLNPQYAGGGFILWTITPRAIEGEPDRAPMYAMFVPPVADETLLCEDGDEPCGPGLECVGWNGADVCRPQRNPRTAYLNVGYQEVCNRQLRGQAVLITPDFERGNPIAGTSVSVRYGPGVDGDPFGVPALEDAPLLERAPQCSSDADCIDEGQFCDLASRQCFLNLVGRVANAVDATTDDSGWFSTPVYTYCEGQTTTPVRRTYTVNVSDRDTERIAERVVPSINYDGEAVFSPPPNVEDKPAGQIDGLLCVPDLGPPKALQVTLRGEPVTLLSGGSADQEYTCCDIGCLPREEGETTGVSESSCTGRTSTDPTVLRLEAPVTLSPAAIAGWIEAGCALPSVADDSDRTIGVLSRIARCTDDSGACEVQGLAAGPDGGARRYRLRLEAPEGSLFRSMDVPVDIQAGDDGPLEIELLPRVLVRGRVMLPDDLCPAAAEGGDCGSANAWVMAERLRWPENDERRPPGPYFQQVQTFVDPVRQTKGHYVLPLDPGVWIVTALPATASLGFPARYEILDLRDAPATTEQNFPLDQGSLVTLKLDDFDRRATVATIDSGSWRDILQHEGRFIDLSNVRECWGDEGQACRIRRLFPLGPIPASQAGQIRFSARLAPGVPQSASRDCFPR